MKTKSYLILGQFLGLLPAKGLLFSESISSLEFKYISIPMIYSWITLLFRLFIKFSFTAIVSNTRLKVYSTFDQMIATNSFILTYCTGCFYQALAMYRTKRYVLLLKDLHSYDQRYPQAPKKNWKIMWNPFVIHNLIYQIATIGFPICIFIFGGRSKAAIDQDEPVHRVVENLYSTSWSAAMMNPAIIIIYLLTEAANMFPVMQLSALVKRMEYNLEGVYEAISDHLKATAKEAVIVPKDKLDDLRLKITKSPETWADQTLYSKLGFSGLSDLVELRRQQGFWKEITQRYLDYLKLFETFTKFSGIYFVILYPMQFISAVFMSYLMVATDVFKGVPLLHEVGCCIIVFSLQRLWSMSNLGHKLEKIRGKSLVMLFGVDEEEIEDAEERYQYDRCIQLFEEIPIQLQASGLFNVRRDNIPVLITAMVSYIIVLFQFQQAVNSNATTNATTTNAVEFNATV